MFAVFPLVIIFAPFAALAAVAQKDEVVGGNITHTKGGAPAQHRFFHFLCRVHTRPSKLRRGGAAGGWDKQAAELDRR